MSTNEGIKRLVVGSKKQENDYGTELKNFVSKQISILKKKKLRLPITLIQL